MKKIFISFFFLVLTNLCFCQSPCPGLETIEYEGKTYHTVQIGKQCWLKENLDVGTRINDSQNATNNSTIEKYCYNDDPANCLTNGGLYQWDEAMQYVTTPGTQGICPRGWHVPTKTEFETLKAAVNDDGNALKTVGQGTDDGAGKNTSGFSALLAGFRINDGYFVNLGYDAGFWSSTEDNTRDAYYMGLSSKGSYIDVRGFYKNLGFSVRCAKD